MSDLTKEIKAIAFSELSIGMKCYIIAVFHNHEAFTQIKDSFRSLDQVNRWMPSFNIQYQHDHSALREVELMVKELKDPIWWNTYQMNNLWAYTDRYIEATTEQKFNALAETIHQMPEEK